MMALSQYKVPSYVQNYNPSNVTVYATDLGGGFQQLANRAARIALPAAKRAVNMMVAYQDSLFRFDGINVTNPVWQNDANWTLIAANPNEKLNTDTLQLGDSVVFFIYGDSLVNTVFVRNYVASKADSIYIDYVNGGTQSDKWVSINDTVDIDTSGGGGSGDLSLYLKKDSDTATNLTILDTLFNLDSLTIKASTNIFKFKNDGFHIGTNSDGSIYTGSLTFANGGNITDAYNTIQIEDDSVLVRNSANDSILLIPGDTSKIISNSDIYIKEIITDSIHNFKTDRIVIPDQIIYSGTLFFGSTKAGQSLIDIGGTNAAGHGNTIMGDSTGMNLTNGHYNTFFGDKAGYATTEGMANTCIGYRAGESIIGNDTIKYNSGVGYSNTFVGSQAGRDCDTGGYNTGVGVDVLHNLTGGKNNCAFGVHAGNNTTTGYYNCFFGFAAGYNNTIGNYNVAIGLNALTGGISVSNAVAIGLNAGGANLADGNVFIGAQSGIANTTGASNFYLGYYSGRYNQTGEQNVFLGSYAGYNMNGGGYNILIGHQTGYRSSGIGTMYYSTLIGCQSFVGSGASGNTALGYRTGYSSVTGGANSFFGYKAGYYELGSNKLYIANSDDRTPLIFGEFDNNKLVANAAITLITQESNMAGTDSCVKFTFETGRPVLAFYSATSSQEVEVTVDEEDHMKFRNASAGYSFDNVIITDSLKTISECSSMADDGTISLPTAKAGKIEIWVSDGVQDEYILARVYTDGSVTLITVNGNTASTDSDGNLCLYDGGTEAVIKQRLGARYNVCYEFKEKQ